MSKLCRGEGLKDQKAAVASRLQHWEGSTLGGKWHDELYQVHLKSCLLQLLSWLNLIVVFQLSASDSDHQEYEHIPKLTLKNF